MPEIVCRKEDDGEACFCRVVLELLNDGPTRVWLFMQDDRPLAGRLLQELRRLVLDGTIVSSGGGADGSATKSVSSTSESNKLSRSRIDPSLRTCLRMSP